MLERSFSRPLLVFRVLGVPVSVEITFVITTFLLAGSRRESLSSFGAWLGVVFVCVLAHEMGHALAGRRFGLVPEVRLHGWGGVTSYSSGPAPDPWRRVAISAAGPAVNMTMGAVAYLARRAAPPDAFALQGVLGDVVWAAGFWGAVNLAPLLPLDGGHVCEALLARFAPAHEAQGSRLVSTCAGVAVAALALAEGWILGGAAALWLGAESARAFVATRRRRADDALQAGVRPRLLAAIDARDGDAVVAVTSSALPRAATDDTRRWLLEHLAIGHALRGAFSDARAAFAAIPTTEHASATIEGFVVLLAVRAKRRALAIEAGADPDAWENAGSPGDGEHDPWEATCQRLRAGDAAGMDAVDFARAREAAEVLGREADAARLGEALFDEAPDPDLAFVLASLWAGAGRARWAERWAAKAAALGFRDRERAAEALAGKAGERARQMLIADKVAAKRA